MPGESAGQATIRFTTDGEGELLSVLEQVSQRLQAIVQAGSQAPALFNAQEGRAGSQAPSIARDPATGQYLQGDGTQLGSGPSSIQANTINTIQIVNPQSVSFSGTITTVVVTTGGGGLQGNLQQEIASALANQTGAVVPGGGPGARDPFAGMGLQSFVPTATEAAFGGDFLQLLGTKGFLTRKQKQVLMGYAEQEAAIRVDMAGDAAAIQRSSRQMMAMDLEEHMAEHSGWIEGYRGPGRKWRQAFERDPRNEGAQFSLERYHPWMQKLYQDMKTMDNPPSSVAELAGVVPSTWENLSMYGAGIVPALLPGIARLGGPVGAAMMAYRVGGAYLETSVEPRLRGIPLGDLEERRAWANKFGFLPGMGLLGAGLEGEQIVRNAAYSVAAQSGDVMQAGNIQASINAWFGKGGELNPQNPQDQPAPWWMRTLVGTMLGAGTGAALGLGFAGAGAIPGAAIGAITGGLAASLFPEGIHSGGPSRRPGDSFAGIGARMLAIQSRVPGLDQDLDANRSLAQFLRERVDAAVATQGGTPTAQDYEQSSQVMSQFLNAAFKTVPGLGYDFMRSYAGDKVAFARDPRTYMSVLNSLVASGDMGAALDVEAAGGLAAGGPELKAAAARIMRRISYMNVLNQRQSIAGEETYQEELDVTQARATMRGYADVSSEIRDQKRRYERQAQVARARLEVINQAVSEDPENETLKAQREQLQSEMKRYETQAASVPFQAIQTEYQGRLTAAGASAQRAETAIQLMQTFPTLTTEEGGGGFSMRRGALIEQRDAAARFIQEMREQGRTEANAPDILRPARAQYEQAQAGLRAIAIQTAEHNRQVMQMIPQSDIARGQTRLSWISTLGLTDEAEYERAYGRQIQGYEGLIRGEKSEINVIRGMLKRGEISEEIAERLIRPMKARIEQSETNILQAERGEVLSPYLAKQAIIGSEMQRQQSQLGWTMQISMDTDVIQGLSESTQNVIKKSLEAAKKHLQDIADNPKLFSEKDKVDTERDVQSLTVELNKTALETLKATYQIPLMQSQYRGQVAETGVGVVEQLGLPMNVAGGYFESRNAEMREQIGISWAQANDPGLDDYTRAQAEARARSMEIQLKYQAEYQQATYPARTAGQVASAAYTTAGAAISYGMAGGLGTLQTMGERQAAVAAADQSAVAAVQQARIAQERLPGSVEAARQTANAAQALAAARQERVTQFGGFTPDVPMQEALAQGQYTIDVLQRVPGSYGNLRGAMMNQQGLLEQQAEQITGMLNSGEAPPGSPQWHSLRNQLRDVGRQQSSLFEQLSFGWESRVTGFMLGNPGAINPEARGMSSRDAILGGVWNPHMGISGQQIPAFMRLTNQWQNIIDYPIMPGQRGIPWGGPGVAGQPWLNRLMGGGAYAPSGNESTIRLVISVLGPGGMQDQVIRVRADGGESTTARISANYQS